MGLRDVTIPEDFQGRHTATYNDDEDLRAIPNRKWIVDP